MVFTNIHTSNGSLLFISVGRVNQHQHIHFFGELNLLDEIFLLKLRHIIVPDLPNGYNTFLPGVSRNEVHRFFSKFFIIGLFGIQANCTIMLDAKLRGPEPLPTYNPTEIVEHSTSICSWLTHPKRGLNHGFYPCPSHSLVIIGGS